MLFNSTVFAQFFVGFLLLYWLFRNNLQARNVLIVVASYYFYGRWDWRFLGLLLVSSLVDYGVGLALERTADVRRRKLLLWISVGINLGILGFFKYFDFFVTSLKEALEGLGITLDTATLGIILPVGISFYTFQTMSYTIDIYRRQMKPTRSLINFMAYVAFFPQLVAGPIERARHLLPQFERQLTITLAMVEEGVSLCIWGMFKKVVLADNLSPLVGMVYDNPSPTSVMVVLATVAFGFQIYCDFSGYTDIARGTAKMLGFEIMVNFRRPYGATSIQEFWRRWHISLSTWLRDYLYISLGGNRRGKVRTYVNLAVTMVLGGLWHGAAWNFVLWGGWHGAGLAAHRLWGERFGGGRREDTSVVLKSAGWGATLAFVLYGWVLFRCGTMDQIGVLNRGLFTLGVPSYFLSYLLSFLVFTLPLIATEIFQGLNEGRSVPWRLPWGIRAGLQGGMILAVLFFWEKAAAPFIYFQF